MAFGSPPFGGPAFDGGPGIIFPIPSIVQTLGPIRSVGGATVPTITTTGSSTLGPLTSHAVAQIFTSVLVLEDGTIVDQANTFALIEAADSYNVLRGRTKWAQTTQVDKQSAILRAMDYIESWEPYLQGYRVSSQQFLSWPRTGVVGRSAFSVPANIVPNDVVAALSESAYQELLSPQVLLPNVNSVPNVKSSMRQVGSLKRQDDYFSAPIPGGDAFNQITWLLDQFTQAGSTGPRIGWGVAKATGGGPYWNQAVWTGNI